MKKIFLVSAIVSISLYANDSFISSNTQPLQVGPQTNSSNQQLVTAQFQTNISSTNLNQHGTKILDRPGHYYLSDHCDFNPFGNNTDEDTAVFYITSDRVNLHLNGKTITQKNNTLNTSAIIIAPGVSHVTITNGSIHHFSGTAIIIGAGCSHICIDNIHISDCSIGGIYAAGTYQLPIKNLKLSNLLSSSHKGNNATFNGTDLFDPFGAKLEHTHNLTIKNCGFNLISTLNEEKSTTGLLLLCCKNISISSSQAILNESRADCAGMKFITCDTILLHNCNSSQNSSIDESTYGFALHGTSNTKIYNCCAQANQGYKNVYGYACIGYDSTIENYLGYFGANYNSIQQCESSGNTTKADNSYGYYSAGNFSNTFAKCTAHANTSGINLHSYAVGFFAETLISNSIAHEEYFLTIEECMSKGQYAQQGTGGGIILDEVHNAYINSNWVINNTGFTNHYGIADLSSNITSTLMINNKAYGNAGINGYNFFATYAQSSAQLPVVSASPGDFRALYSTNPYSNIEWNDYPRHESVG